MNAFWKIFWWCIASFSALVGLYLAARTEDLEWAFWLVVGGSLLVAAIAATLPRAAGWIVAIRNYPKLIERAGTLGSRVETLEKQVFAAESSAATQRDQGISEGVRRAYGALKANSTHVPKMVGVGMDSGTPMIFAEWEPRHYVPGSRYDVEVAATGKSKGVVEVRRFDETRKIAAMALVVNLNEAFWEEVERKAETEAGPLPGIKLRPAELVDPWIPKAIDTTSNSSSIEETTDDGH